MALFGRKKPKNDDKEIKDIINKHIASSLRTQPSFGELLKLNGCPTIKLGVMGSKIRKQLLKEAKNGDLTTESVMPRAYELIGEYLGIYEVKTFGDMAGENNVTPIPNIKPKYCGNCGISLDNNAKFCPNCGEKLIKDELKCSNCGEINELNSKYCINCGNDLVTNNKSDNANNNSQIPKQNKINHQIKTENDKSLELRSRNIKNKRKGKIEEKANVSEKEEIKPIKIPIVVTTEIKSSNSMDLKELDELDREQKLELQQYEKKRKLLNKWADNNLKGQDLEAEGKIDEAIECYEENVKLNADTPFTYDRLAYLYHSKYEFEKERETLKLFIKRCNDNPNVNKSYKIDNIKRLENVEQFLETGKWKYDCLPADTKLQFYEVKEAKTLLNSEDREKGIEMLENLMNKGSFNNTVYYTLYQTYKKDKNYDDAIRVCEKAIEVLGFFSNDRLSKWVDYRDKLIIKKEKESSK